MATPTRDDALLMVQLARWGTELGIEGAIAQILSDDFDPNDADVLTDPPVRSILMYGESIGTLTKNNLLSNELVQDWIWVNGLWARVGPAARKQRDKYGEPKLWENFEALAKG
jgi:hypothetical protein